ncbi:sodium:proton antiporter [Anoxybacillus ayderensis]|uniref:Na+/H+ antiporter family protein n=1 Tax=Anoxybacillus sp. ST70 TaxID=2864180 RepID=UPI0003066B86|nr:Na+/H+ antiporter family protein [Anoxybacillus sp. ST70]AXM90316.1 sodium:proton antiporter [Anoxybacillus ayderensis G10]MBW9218739.1 Na+/H+ antiporter family protein [Anoxybacillus sp. ST70]THD17501.1 sodium:proton antiporter [Anoxybacillus ayderensis]
MNAVVISVLVMLILSLLRMNVVFSLLIASLVGGLIGNLSLSKTVEVFSEGLGNSAEVALSYALLGGFAIAISKTGLPNAIVHMIIKMVGKQGESKRKQYSKALVLLVILFMSCFSQNLIPIHIAFIPILIPPLLHILNELHVDRRLVASITTFGLITPYMWLPTGFGAIFHDIVQSNMAQGGLVVAKSDIPKAMFFPSLGMIVGLLLAFFTYRKPRTYKQIQLESEESQSFQKRGVWFAIVAVITALTVQLVLDSMIFGAFAGIVVIYLSGCIRLTEGDRLLTEGMRMMAFIGFVMLSASGFANVLKQTGHIEKLVEQAASLIGHNTALGALLMLIVGLLVTMGIGSSFSTVPIIATIFVPLCIKLGLSPMATIAIIGAAGALGDAGSPASDSTLGPTSGLNVDGQHHHIWDTCVPTFIHYNIPVIIFAWIAAMIL